jgi:hypothetical protein
MPNESLYSSLLLYTYSAESILYHNFKDFLLSWELISFLTLFSLLYVVFHWPKKLIRLRSLSRLRRT